MRKTHEIVPGGRDLRHLAGYSVPLTASSLVLEIINDIELNRALAQSESQDRVGGDGVLRLIRQFVMDFERAGNRKADLLTQRPRLTGFRHIDAMVAGLVEHLAFHSGLKVPAWTREVERYTKLPWFGFQLGYELVHVHAMLRGPISLRNHGIFIDSSSFVNI